MKFSDAVIHADAILFGASVAVVLQRERERAFRAGARGGLFVGALFVGPVGFLFGYMVRAWFW